MNPLYDKIRYDGKLYAETTDLIDRREIEILAANLKPLEIEILNATDLTISIIKKTENIFVSSSDSILSDKISKIFHARH